MESENCDKELVGNFCNHKNVHIANNSEIRWMTIKYYARNQKAWILRDIINIK